MQKIGRELIRHRKPRHCQRKCALSMDFSGSQRVCLRTNFSTNPIARDENNNGDTFMLFMHDTAFPPRSECA